jgi:MT0933-like antitoxin protein
MPGEISGIHCPTGGNVGIFDNFKNKADDLTGKDTDQASDGLDKAGEFVNDQTGNRFGSQVDQGVDLANQQLGNFGGQASDATDEASDMADQSGAADIPQQATNM